MGKKKENFKMFLHKKGKEVWKYLQMDTESVIYVKFANTEVVSCNYLGLLRMKAGH